MKYSLITPRPPNDDVIPIINIRTHFFDEARRNIVTLLISNATRKIYVEIIYTYDLISIRMSYIYGLKYIIEI